ncbi:MAG: hypothetical protein EBR40_03055 [Proteobacteria bacterium]|nr:hypothetical protein [Pseudomonadota bacterium]
MNPGDLVRKLDWNCELNPRLLGILLEVKIDKKLLKSPFGVPWIYKVVWNDGIIKEHEMGSLRRVSTR